MVLTYIVVDAFCILLASVIGKFINSDFGSKDEVLLLRKALASYCGFLISGLVSIIMENGYIPMVIPVIWIANMCSLFLISLLAYYGFLFVEARLHNSLPSKWLIRVAKVPIVLVGLINLSTPFTGWVFTVTDTGRYQRGPFLGYTFLVAYGYTIVIVVHAIAHSFFEKKQNKKYESITIGVCMIFPIIAGVIQLMVYATCILAPSILTTIFFIFINIQSAQIYNDALTGINNRRRACQYLEERILVCSKEKPIILYMLDINEFKKINDQYGHTEGDNALKIVADTLLKLCNLYNLFIARYGGDEFIIISASKWPEATETIINTFHRLLSNLCEERQVSYKLTVSIGSASSFDAHENMHDLINRADKALYTEKDKYYNSMKNQKPE